MKSFVADFTSGLFFAVEIENIECITLWDTVFHTVFHAVFCKIQEYHACCVLKKKKKIGEMQHSITRSPMDPLQWMGAVRMRVQTADKNIIIMHTTPVHQLMSWEDKSCVFVRNKSTIKTFLTLNRCFWLKYESITHNIVSSNKITWFKTGHGFKGALHLFPLKGIVQPKIKICWKCAHPKAIQDVDEFVSSGSVIMGYGLVF